MACKLYIRIYGAEIRAGSFKNRTDAEAFYNRNRETFRQKDGQYGTPIYVETRKVRKE